MKLKPRIFKSGYKNQSIEYQCPIGKSKILIAWFDKLVFDNFWYVYLSLKKTNENSLFPYVFILEGDKAINWDKVYPNGIGFYIERKKVIFAASVGDDAERSKLFCEAVEKWYWRNKKNGC